MGRAQKSEMNKIGTRLRSGGLHEPNLKLYIGYVNDLTALWKIGWSDFSLLREETNQQFTTREVANRNGLCHSCRQNSKALQLSWWKVSCSCPQPVEISSTTPQDVYESSGQKMGCRVPTLSPKVKVLSNRELQASAMMFSISVDPATNSFKVFLNN